MSLRRSLVSIVSIGVLVTLVGCSSSATIQGSVKYEDNLAPAQNVLVVLSQEDNKWESKTDSDGQFVFKDVKPGQASIVAHVIISHHDCTMFNIIYEIEAGESRNQTIRIPSSLDSPSITKLLGADGYSWLGWLIKCDD